MCKNPRVHNLSMSSIDSFMKIKFLDLNTWNIIWAASAGDRFYVSAVGIIVFSKINMLKISKWMQYLKFILELPFKSYYDWIMYNPTVTSSYFKTAWFECIDGQTVTLTQDKQLSYWKYLYIVRFDADVGAAVKIAAFWNVMPCGLVEIDWHFRGTCIRHQGRRVPITSLQVSQHRRWMF
jgi:hypothetical protein